MKYILLFFFISLHSFAQCDFIKNKKDDFTGKQIKEVGTSGLKIIQQDTSYFYEQTVAIVGASGFEVKEGSTLYLKLDNDSVLSLFVGKSQFKGTNASGASIVLCSIDKSQLETLSKYKIVKYKMNGTSKDKEGSFNSKQTKKLQEGVACLLNQ